MKSMYCMLRGTQPSTIEFEHETVYSVDIFQGTYSVGAIGKRMSKAIYEETFFQCQEDGASLPGSIVEGVKDTPVYTPPKEAPSRKDQSLDMTKPTGIDQTSKNDFDFMYSDRTKGKLTALDVIKSFKLHDNYYVASAVTALLNGGNSADGIFTAIKFLNESIGTPAE